MPQISNVTYSPFLTNFSLAYQPPGFIVNEQNFPIINVQTLKGTFFGSGKEMFTRESDLRGLKDRANAVDHDYQAFSYAAIEHSLLEEIPMKVINEAQRTGVAQVLKIEQDAARIVETKLALGREVDVATQLRDTTQYASGNSVTLSGSGQWSDYVNSDPILALNGYAETIRSKIGRWPNTAFVPHPVWQQLMFHPQVLNKMSVTGIRQATTDLVAQLINVERIIVPNAIYNVAAQDTSNTFTTSDIWGKDVILCQMDQNPGIGTLSFYAIFRARYPETNMLAESRTWDETDRRLRVIEGNYQEDRKVLVPEAGYLIKAAVA